MMTSENLFQFVNVRPAREAPQEHIVKRFTEYDKKEKSPLHKKVEGLEGEHARNKAIDMASDFLENEQKELDQNHDYLKNLIEKALGQNSVAEAKKTLEQALEQPLKEYVKSERAVRLKDLFWDLLYAHTLAPEKRPENRERVYEGVRAFHFLELLTNQKENDKPLTEKELSKVTPAIPMDLVPRPFIEKNGNEDKQAKQVREKLKNVYDKLKSINTTIKEIKNVDRIHKAQKSRKVTEYTEFVTEIPTLKGPKFPDFKVEGIDQVKTIEMNDSPPWIFEGYGQEFLSKSAWNVLSGHKASFEELEPAEVISGLEGEKYTMANQFVRNLPKKSMQYVIATSEFKAILEDVPIAHFHGDLLEDAMNRSNSAADRGIKPLGIGDLLVVKQELRKYTAGEVAHIENIMQGEFKTRTHSRSRETEDIIITETEQLEENEKDLQTTERFELQKEAQKTIEDQMSLKAGASISAEYGPVSASAYADYAINQSASQSSKTASSFAKSVTERSVSRIEKRAREERTHRTLERFTETNEHGFNNKDNNNSGHVIGIYRWVDKHYKAKLVNYGRRLMIEFILPEPAAFYLQLQSQQKAGGFTMEKPKKPMVSGKPLQPEHLNKSNYTDFVAEYNVQDVEAYPDEVKRISAAFAETTHSDFKNAAYAKTNEKLVIPPDYICDDFYGKMKIQGNKDTDYFLICNIAGQSFGSVTAYGLEGVIPISVNGWLTAFQINVVAKCRLKPEAKQAWQIKTYQAIMNAYEQQLAEYNEQLAAAQIQAGVEIEGRNPEFNRKIVQDELKKGSLRMLTNDFAKTRVDGTWRSNEMFNAMEDNGEYGYREFNISEAIVEGKMVQFFEQSFEWQNMTYLFYPYFWGRKSNWDKTFPLTDIDPQFTDFLRAGSARVVIPVHPEYNETVLHYMATNEIWNGGNPPALNDPLFISIIDELKENAEAYTNGEMPVCSPDSQHPCQMDEWDVKLPTTLVYLQEDGELPDFTD
ncbi:hypothetical protein [Bacillus marinisedimentorum]|uniref:hypothetical protein n=1 Tax=Bacillus marinisedimentorum TaxID=1821260 RepID=UPI001B80802B|nr:hypothetical protein [Bacillus marinisedimentorum]